MKKLRVLAMTQRELVPPEGELPEDEVAKARWKTDYDVRNALAELGHEVFFVGEDDDLLEVRKIINDVRPHIVFNLMEFFANRSRFLPHVLGYLELIDQPYTGCNPFGMMLSLDKGLQRKILRHHRIATPEFALAPVGRVFKMPTRMKYPVIVKSAKEHGSRGIAHASVINTDEKLAERIEHVHYSVGTDAIVEEFIEGREIYVGVLGNIRLEALPTWELSFTSLTEGAPNIATYRVKWDIAYQEQIGLTLGPAKLDETLETRIHTICKRAYRTLDQSGYCRFDFRLRDDGRVVLIESNPNPDLAYDAEFADAAKAAGYEYPRLIQRILTLGLSWTRRLRTHE
jgi:D-alanine-D-alanine ligase